MGKERTTLGLWLHDAWELLVPRRCAGCDGVLLSYEELLCDTCRGDLPFTRFNEDPLNPVERLFHGKVPMQAAGALFRFSPQSMVQRMLHRVKYKHDRDVAMMLGRMMGEAIAATRRFDGVDTVIAVPLHPRKERQRGYNQSRLLADGISQVVPLEPMHHALQRVERTASQTRKGRMERWWNVKEAFEAGDAAALSGRHVLIVDDVVTTGSTAEGCAQAILRASGARVSFFAAACA